ncbi:unnamed protein product, partial [marine sediment metagenome]
KRDDFAEDRFHKLVMASKVVDIEEPVTMETLFKQVSEVLSIDLGIKSEELYDKLYEREMQTSTVVRDGLAIPHIVVDVENAHRIVLVRARTGIIFPGDKLVHVAFVLVGSTAIRGRSLHLKDLVAIAQTTQNPEFDKKWLEAKNKEELKSILLLAERSRGQE